MSLFHFLILYSQKFSSGENFNQIRHLLSLVKIFIREFFFFFFYRFKDCIVDMATFIALVKILPLDNYYNTSWLGLAKILSHENFQLYGNVVCFFV